MGIAILIIFVLAIVGAIVWFFLKNKKEEPSVQPEKPSEPASQPSAPPVDEVPKEDEKEPEKTKEKPMFEVGDFILNGDVTDEGKPEIFKVLKVCGTWYDVENVYDGRKTIITFKQEYSCRMWNISEAKAGDVLYLQKDGKEHIIIYKGVIKEGFRTFVSAYCAYNGIVDAFCFADVSRYADIAYGSIMPATKEQRAALFQKMKESGYEFNAEKKKLVKLE